MTNRFLLLFVLSFITFSTYGQRLTSPTVQQLDPHLQQGPDVRICPSTIWDAGTSNQTLDGTNQNTTPEPSGDEFYLCFNDLLNIDHDGNFNLDPAVDPDPSTPAGIYYVFYTCAPTNTGPDASDISSDPCVLPNPIPPLFFVDGVVNAVGDGVFLNDGALQNGLNGGDPIDFWFAPVTIDDHANTQFLSNADGDICLNVTASDAFRVVFLNEITLSNINNNVGGNCNGSIDIQGGLSQFEILNGDPVSTYTITVEKAGDPSITGTITSGPISHGGTVTFTVPENGIYNIIVEDGKSCGNSVAIDMNACVGTVSATYTGNDVSCNGLSDGEIEVDITGGSPNYTIEWQSLPGGAVQSGNLAAAGQFTIPTLNSGNYGVTVTDNSGTTSTGNVFINQPGALGASLIDLIPPSCNGDTDGSVTVQLTSDGVIINPDPTQYTFTWNTPQTTQTITNLPFGPYSVTVSDANNCTATASATLSQPPAINAPPIAGVDASCIGINDGSATINATGGTGVLAYSWSGSTSTTAMATDLAVGTHTVTVTDINSCTYTDVVVINAATTLTATAAATDVSCFGLNDGQVTATPVIVGTDNGGYSYAWSPAGNTPTLNNLVQGTYTVTITDANGCTATNEDTVNEPTVLSATTVVTNESCTVGNDGQVTVVPMGGSVAPGLAYSYNWNNSNTTSTISNLNGNTYTVTVSDDNGCTVSAEGIVLPPTGPVIVSFDTIGILCATDINGSITVNATQGNDPITNYDWSNSAAGNINNNIGPGNYTVTITDAGGCVTTGEQSLYAPPIIEEANPPVIQIPNCPGGGDASITLDITGGIEPYNYVWSNSAAGPAFDVLTNITAGTYTVTVSDANACTLVISNIVVNDPPAINVLYQNVQPVSCFSGIPCDGQATIVASGGLSTNYTFTWASGETSTGGNSSAVQLCQGNQNVTVTDGFCTVVFDMGADSIPAPPIVSIADIQTTNVSCFGDTNGSATITPTGGNGGPYSIVWSTGATGPTATNLSPNTNYSVNITDGLGCTSFPFTVTVGEPNPLQLIVIDTLDITCNGDNNGVIQVAPIGGNSGVFTYEWSPNTTETLNTAANLSPGTYSITATDVNGCTATNTATITEPEAVTFEYTDPVEPICNGFPTIFPAFDTVYGGSGGPYLYTIDGFNFNPTTQPTDILAGTYTIEIIDAAGECTATQEITIDEPAPILVDLGPDVEIQLGESYEIIPTVTPLGALDSLSWTPATGLSCTDCFNPTASPTDDQTYTLLVTDSNGCFGSDDILIDIDPNRNVYIPNAFSPNNDSTNDVFKPYIGAGVSNIKSMIVLDRWGELVYKAEDFIPDDLDNNGWDGTFRGKVMNPGVFVYIIEVEFLDGISLRYKGDVTLFR